MKSVQEATTDLYNVCCQQMTNKIKSGEFSAADVQAAVKLIQASKCEISFDSNEDAQDLETALHDADSGEKFDLSRPPEYNPGLRVC